MNQEHLQLLRNLKSNLDQLDYELLHDDELMLTILFKQNEFLSNFNDFLTSTNELIEQYENVNLA